MKYRIPILLLSVFFTYMATAQTDKRTIDITSSFKPSLRELSKPGYTANPANPTNTSPRLSYDIPVQNLSFGFTPAPIRPLAYTDTIAFARNTGGYVKAGFGNFTTPYLYGNLGFGDGIKMNGNVEAEYIQSKGKLPFQQFMKPTVKASLLYKLNSDHDLRLAAGYEGLQTYRYGYYPSTLPFTKTDLSRGYNTLFGSATLNNLKEEEADFNYNPKLDFHFTGANYNEREAFINLNAPVSRQIGENAKAILGLQAGFNSLKTPDALINANLIALNLAFETTIRENILAHIGVISGWSKGEFRLLPDINVDFLIRQSRFVFQAGWMGGYTQNHFRSLIGQNPWINTPGDLYNTSSNEFYGAIKGVLDDHLSFRLKAGLGNMRHVPLFINDATDGKSFDVVYEPKVDKLSIAAELSYMLGDKFNWYTSLKLNSFGGMRVYPQAYGLMPFELQSSARFKLIKDLYIKGDLFNFSGGRFRSVATGVDGRLSPAFDLNLGAEYRVWKFVGVWIQGQNLLNKPYMRWNQYPVLGTQVLGGVTLSL